MTEIEMMRTTLKKYFSTYELPMKAEKIGELLNRVAWERRSMGWKLLGKKGGSNVPMPNGELISADYLVLGVVGWDVFYNVGGIDSYVTGPSGSGEDMSLRLANGSRTLVNPIPPLNEPIPQPGSDNSELVEKLSKRILELETEIEGLRRNASIMYDNFVHKESHEIAEAYKVKNHGPGPSESDLYHTAWRRLVESWTHEDILKDI